MFVFASRCSLLRTTFSLCCHFQLSDSSGRMLVAKNARDAYLQTFSSPEDSSNDDDTELSKASATSDPSTVDDEGAAQALGFNVQGILGGDGSSSNEEYDSDMVRSRARLRAQEWVGLRLFFCLF